MLRPPIFVINLPESAGRRAQITRALNEALLPHTLVPAVDGRTLEGKAAAVADVPQRHLGRPLSRGEIGCLLSHIAVLERVVRDRIAHACVLEDDVALADDVPEILDVLLTGAGDWELVLLGHHSARHSPKVGAETCTRQLPLNDRRTIARVAEFPMGAYAYMITWQAAERLLAHALPLRMPMDWITGYAPAAGVRLHAVTPPCITPDGFGHDVSTIDARDSGPAKDAAAGATRGSMGRWWLAARKAGFWTDSYVKKF